MMEVGVGLEWLLLPYGSGDGVWATHVLLVTPVARAVLHNCMFIK